MGPMKKRRRADDEDDDDERPTTSTPAEVTIGKQTSHIKNKVVRSELYSKLKHKKMKAKKQKREKAKKAEEKALELGQDLPPKKIPKTLENTREKDETMVQPGDEEVEAEEHQDEFAAHFRRDRPPKVLITTCYQASKIMYQFISEMMELLPCAEYYKRGNFPLKKIIKFANNRDFTDILVFNENRKTINGMLVIHLPDGPTALFRLSSLVLGKDIRGHGRSKLHKPELILNNFNTQLGHRIGRMFASLFHQDPAFKGRQVVTFHNQRDFVFVRHHRYIFDKKDRRNQEGKKRPVVVARLQELGPRFTLRLESLQKGTFDSQGGEYEWMYRRKNMDTSRRRFHL